VDVPSDLEDLFAVLPVTNRSKRQLTKKLTEPSRYYHGVGHIEVLWQRHCLHAVAGLADPAWAVPIACAIAYHDSIYDGHRRDNEELSALFWLEASAGTAIGAAERAWVADTIRATSDHLSFDPTGDLAIEDRARLWMLDLDLTPLGESADVFDENFRNLRLEVPKWTDQAFLQGTLGFLRRMATAPRIYRSPLLADLFEAAARANLERTQAMYGSI
jgi:predicted metal-dependent HD superfamily phosphohydrolase